MDLSRFRAGAAATAFRHRYGVPHRPTIAYVGRLDREKNLDVVVHALAGVRHRIPDAQLLLVGTGDQRRRLTRLAARLGVADALVCTGYVEEEDLPAAYAAADVFVNAGTAELQSLVTLEAMATGLPVLGAEAAALPHLVHHGHNGFLFPPGDHDTLAEHLVTVLSDHNKAKTMGVRSRALAEGHDIARTVAAFEHLYMLRISGPEPARIAA
jgi:glycosyltransferase involved in cell wall biosynthesis